MKKENLYKVLFLLTALFNFLIPLNTKISNVLLILVFLFLVIEIYINKKNIKFESGFWLNSTFILYIITLIGLNWFDIGFGLVRLETRLSLVLFSILFFIKYSVLEKLYMYSKKGLLYGAILSSITLLVLQIAYFNSIIIKQASDFFNYYTLHHYYSGRLHFHATYLSFFYLLVIHVMIIEKNIKNRYLNFFFILILLINQVFLNSRLILGIQIFMLMTYLISNKTIEVKYKLMSVSLILMISFFSLFVVRNTYFFERLKGIVWELTENSATNKLGDSRYSRWKVALEVAKEKPIFGYGTGNEKKALFIKFKEHGLDHSAESFYDSHNQFLSILVENGVFLFAVFMGLIIVFSYKTWLHGDSFQKLFLISSLLLFTLETSLNVNVFLTFFAFYLNLNLALFYRKLSL